MEISWHIKSHLAIRWMTSPSISWAPKTWLPRRCTTSGPLASMLKPSSSASSSCSGSGANLSSSLPKEKVPSKGEIFFTWRPKEKRWLFSTMPKKCLIGIQISIEVKDRLLLFAFTRQQKLCHLFHPFNKGKDFMATSTEPWMDPSTPTWPRALPPTRCCQPTGRGSLFQLREISRTWSSSWLPVPRALNFT